ncbi:hypothetical protein FN846DRAFT_615588 [Sphaerosporella brunnea]|uniref:Rhodopsin domain-containing protein n=1 Tax=Sphaerosporella brunnea TaxID=1250544 RepID=A0A5J5F0L6_9PEZI|nr:hypothetical protein FN846DRAFT_615588 [Sphaerosporella brunnea]
MLEDAWLAVLVLFFALPTILVGLRIYYDANRYLRSGYLASSVISLVFAIAAYLFFALACAMVFYRSQKRVLWMDRPAQTVVGGMHALGQPLREATIVHSYIVPTGLWLCKGSFVAMYFNLKRHLNEKTKRLLYGTVAYLILTFLVLILTHALWCDRVFGKQWALTATTYCTPFASSLTIGLYAFCNITSDILVLTIPLVILHYITVLPRERYAIVFLLVLGVGTIATTATCCALHITYRHELVVYYNYIQVAELLACIELSVGMMAASLPSLKALLYRKRERVRRKVQGSVGESKHGHSSQREEEDEEEELERLEDQGRLVIMRHVSYDVEVESIELPPAAVAKTSV